jgi:type I restriction enzyme M protein
MLTLPSNMFYTVTLPATLWFFDKAKNGRQNPCSSTPATSSPRSTAPTANSAKNTSRTSPSSATCTKASGEFVQLIDRYFAAGHGAPDREQRPRSNRCRATAGCAGRCRRQAGSGELLQQWRGLDKLQARYAQYIGRTCRCGRTSTRRTRPSTSCAMPSIPSSPPARRLEASRQDVRQHEKQQAEAGQAEGKRGTSTARPKRSKPRWKNCTPEVKHAEIYFQHIHWLQERFPKRSTKTSPACANWPPRGGAKEQDYSLNPGRYVGVVIEEDGKTEEEFVAELLAMKNRN